MFVENDTRSHRIFTNVLFFHINKERRVKAANGIIKWIINERAGED